MKHMKTLKYVTAFGLFVLALCVSYGAVAQTSVPDLLAKLPAQTTQEGDQIFGDLIKLGPAAIAEICSQLVPQGTGDDLKQRFAITGIADRVTRGGPNADREMFSKALLGALGKATDNEVRTFLMGQIQLVGGNETIASLSASLADAAMCEPATQALTAIGTPEAVAALAKALPSAQGANRLTLVNAIGALRCADVVPELLKDAASDDALLRHAAWFALANIGAPEAQPVLAKAALSSDGLEMDDAVTSCLLFACRLAESGKSDVAEGICRDLLKAPADETKPHIPSAALATLVDIKKADALPDLIAAMDSPNKEIRGCALQQAARIDGRAATEKWADKMKSVSPEVRAEILYMLGKRGDKAALDAVTACLADPDKAVRVAAVNAAILLAPVKVVPELLALIQKSEDADEIKAVKSALMRAQEEKWSKQVADALPSATPAAKEALLEVLGSRRATNALEAVFAQTKDGEVSVRVAALKALANVAAPVDLARVIDHAVDAKEDKERSTSVNTIVGLAAQIEDPAQRADSVLAALPKASAESKGVLFNALAGIGGAKALEAVVAAAEGGKDAVREAAVRALADWCNPEAAPPLLQAAGDISDETLQVVAMRGYIRLASMDGISPEEKVKMYQRAISTAKRNEEKGQAISGLAKVRTMESLNAVAPLLDDEALKKDAALAVFKIACPQDENDAGLSGAEVAAIITKAAPLIENEDQRKAAEAHAAKQTVVPAPTAQAVEEGFTSLFNGVDLTGWVGDTNGYVVENGSIVCRPGGNLFTQGEYGDFVFRFEFKLTPGANNGLGIRAPLHGNAAYDGMELQILEDTHEKYKDLKPYQFHGSIYGVVPAKHEGKKPVGEWNSEEVIAQGNHIVVNLNGVNIVDADIKEAAANGTMDHQPHPGLFNPSGHIGFLGHGDVLEFRNIRIKELK